MREGYRRERESGGGEIHAHRERVKRARELLHLGWGNPSNLA